MAVIASKKVAPSLLGATFLLYDSIKMMLKNKKSVCVLSQNVITLSFN